MVGIQQEFFGDVFHQFVLYLAHVFAFGNACAIGDAENVCVHGHCRLAKSGVQHHIRGFATDTRQAFQLGTGLRHFTTKLIEQDFTRGDDMGGFGAIKTDGFDGVAHFLFTQSQHRLRSGRHGIQHCRDFVHRHIGGLRRQQHRNQQLKRIIKHQFCGGVRISGL